jgi:AGZA family xanthine/uracil permease-like MFS transporter
MEAMIGILLWIGLIITAQAFEAVPKKHLVAVALGLIPALAAWGLLLIETTLRKSGASLYEVAPKFGNDLYIDGIIALSQGFMLTCMILAAMLVFVIERQFLPAALWTATAALLSFFGLIHAYELTPVGVQNRIGVNAAGTYALAYLGTAAILLALHYYHRGRKVEKTGIVA